MLRKSKKQYPLLDPPLADACGNFATRYKKNEVHSCKTAAASSSVEGSQLSGSSSTEMTWCGMLLLTLLLPGQILCAPAVPSEEAEVIYDQRQNGTENYRIHVDGVVIVHAPVESLLALGAAAGASGGDLESEMEFEQQLLELLTGTTPPPSSATGNATTTTSEKPILPEGDTNGTTTEGSTSEKPASLREEQPEHIKHRLKTRPRLRIANFLMPLLRRL